MTPYLTQRLGVDEFARLAVLLAYINWISVFAFLGTHGALKILGVKDKSSAKEVLWAGLAVACLSGGAASIVGVFGAYLGYYDFTVAWLVAFTAGTQAVLLLVLSYFHVIKDLKRFVMVAVIAPSAGAALTIVLLENAEFAGYLHRVLAVFLGNLIVLLIAFRAIGVSKVRKQLFVRVLSLTWPLAVIQTGQISLFLLDRVLLDLYATAQDVAEYAIYMQLVMPVSMGIKALNQVRTVDIYETLKIDGASRILVGEVRYIICFFNGAVFAGRSRTVACRPIW